VSSNGDQPETIPMLVRIRPDAWQEIKDLPYELYREVGCWLVGVSDDLEIVVLGVRQNAPGSEPYAGTNDSIHLSGEWMADIDQSVSGADWRVVGHLHSHPGRSERDLLQTSSADEDSAAAFAGAGDFVSLIVTEGEDEIPYSRVHKNIRAHITSRLDRTTRPAPLIVERSY
jgi:hypothetical protein